MSKIAELKAGDGNVDIEATVVSVAEPRTFEKFGREGRVAKAVIKDDSGEITLTLWNDQVDQIKAGKKIKLTKGYVGEFKGERQLSTGKFGALEVL